MHSFQYDHVTIHHNNDLRSESDVMITYRDDEGHAVEAQVPQQALVEFVAQLVANERIAALEQAKPLEVLGVKTERI